MVSQKRRRCYRSYRGEIGPTPDNLLARDYKAHNLIKKRLTDITEFQLPTENVWLSLEVDCFDGKVVSWSFSHRPDVQHHAGERNRDVKCGRTPCYTRALSLARTGE